MSAERGWADLSPGEDFAGYRIERSLGRGGMGILYLAVEPGLERRVALKLIAPEAAADEVFARRFAEESRIAASIEHPNVVPIYAAGEEGGVPYLAMRFVSGSDLGRRIVREGRLSPPQTAALIAQVGNGLDAIHAAGLVHRDVKPANVLLSGEPGSEHVYITDFGVARNLATESGLTQTGRFVGTLDYVAPEQIDGGPIDARVDVYALGCLLFKLLTGEVPFPREGEAARLYAHLHDPPPAPSLQLSSLPPALDEVVGRALAKEPAERYQSAGDLGRAAEAAVAGAAVTVPERTVATGAAATRERRTPTAATAVATGGEGTAEPGKPVALARSRRPLLLGGALVAIAAIAVGVAIASSGGGGGGGDGAGAGTTRSSTSAQGAKAPPSKPKPEALSAPALIAKGDAICEESQSTFMAVGERFENGENEANLAYSQELVGISSLAVERFDRLQPPKALKPAYDAYVKSQREVAKWDRDALKAAEEGDLTAYLDARESRNATQQERKALAEAVGFTVCSGSSL